jgi:hypothetical protein
VVHLLLGHLVEDLGAGGVLLAQALSKSAIDAVVLLLVGYGQRENFLFGELGNRMATRSPG